MTLHEAERLRAVVMGEDHEERMVALERLIGEARTEGCPNAARAMLQVLADLGSGPDDRFVRLMRESLS